jgi:hypothetical protein
MRWTVESSSSSLSALVYAFTKSDLHRLMILFEQDIDDLAEPEYRLVSQSDVVRYVYNELFQDFSAEFGSISVSKMLDARVNRKVIKVDEEMTALACFKVCVMMLLTILVDVTQPCLCRSCHV